METKGGFYITQIKQLQERIFEKLLSEAGIELSGGQGRILFVLWKKDRLTVGEIARETSLAKNTVSAVVDGMVRKGILERAVNPDNRREIIVSLTEHARGMRKKYEAVSQQMNELFYRGFTEEEREQFEEYLARIRETLTQAENVRKSGGQAGQSSPGKAESAGGKAGRPAGPKQKRKGLPEGGP